MAAGVITNFHCRAVAPAFFPTLFHSSPCKEDEEKILEEKQEFREDEEEEREVDEEDEESEAQEDEEECLEGVFSAAADNSAPDVTKQLLRFADVISHDVQRYFGRCSDDQEACDIYSDSVSITAGGRLRYYDDLLKIARAGSPEAPEGRVVTSADEDGVGGLGPLAELFSRGGPSRGRGRPMVKRHLPLSFWAEPTPCCSADVTHTSSETPSQDGTHTDPDTHMHYNTHGLDSTQPDFSDLLANWDPNPEFTHTLTENTHMQH
ncbi:protein PERCC1 [Brachionichthys hirsutus]|uniref:protein PERCC1 n=1 Tax=Brachionichthys hirsutus TaxID=412623 RepID=UPI0036047EF2